MTITFLTFGTRETASTRYRVLQYIPLLEQDGFRTRVVIYPAHNRSASRFEKLTYLLRAMMRAIGSDIVFIQKILLPIWVLRVLRIVSKRLIFDFDDAIWLNSSEEKLDHVLQNVDRVLAGNEYLLEYAKKNNSKSHLLPTAIDSSLYTHFTKHETERFCIGWIGQKNNFQYLESLTDVFEQLATKFGSQVYLKVISDGSFTSQGAQEIKNVQWIEQTEIEELAECSIGVMPLTDTAWARGKCGFKALQYMALGIVPIASPVGVNTKIITDGQTGFLPANSAQWLDAIESLIQSPDRRSEMGQAAQKFFEANYSLKSIYPSFKNVLKQS